MLWYTITPIKLFQDLPILDFYQKHFAKMLGFFPKTNGKNILLFYYRFWIFFKKIKQMIICAENKPNSRQSQHRSDIEKETLKITNIMNTLQMIIGLPILRNIKIKLKH